MTINIRENKKMSTNQLVVLSLSKPLLSLNIQKVNDVFCGFREGDFAVIQGSATSVTSLLCVRGQLPNQLGGLNSKVLFIDGGNTFDVYQIAQLAQAHHLNPKQVLDNIYISRAFTAYQVTTLIMQKLKTTIKKSGAKLVIISDLAGFFLDTDLPDYEAERVFSQILTYLSNFAKENKIVLVTTYLPHKSNRRNSILHNLAVAKANVVLSLTQTKYTRAFCIEKHPYLKLGSVELPSKHTTLIDFIGESA
jgi:hypothetical protein